MSRDRSFPLLLLCFFLSGLAALVYETAWTREFAFVFGTSELAVATVLAAYMAGLAAGAALAGRFARRLRRPVLAYGLLELGIALAALAVPFGVTASRWLYTALFGGHDALPDAGGLTTSLFYLACSFVILLVPTAMMGATLPLLARHAVREDRQIGGRVGVLYATNTAGAVSGTLLGAFVLLPHLGLRTTIAAAAGLNALVFAAAWALARASGPLPAAAEPTPATAAAPGGPRWILPLIGISGFASFTYEVMWVRLLGHVVGAGVQAFATMLASFLAGIAIGSAVASRFATGPERAAAGFGAAQLGIALLSFAAFHTIDSIPDPVTLQRWGIPEIWGETLACMLTLFPAALCIGATFPFAVRVLARGGDDAGPASARIFSANTVGSILGSVAAGFWLVPELGFEGTLLLCIALNLLLALAAALLFGKRRPLLLGSAVALGVGVALLPPGTPWNTLRFSSLGGGARAWGPVQYFAVGRSSTVLVNDQLYAFGLRNNGLPEAGMQRPGTWINRHPLTRWLGALPVLARPDTKSYLLVGLGGGMAIEIVPESIERIDVIELEPEVLAANRNVAELRWRDPLSDPRVHVHLNDARNALLLASEARFDAIVSQPSHPWAGGAAHLYTLEFFELVKSRLTPEGVFVQWIGLPFVDEALLRSLLATLAEVFPHVQAYDPPPGGSLLFLASNAPLDLHASTREALERVPEDLAMLGIASPEDVLASWMLDDAGVRELAAGAPLNRDRHNRLQNYSHRLGRKSLGYGADALLAPLDPLVRSLPEGTDVLALLRRLDPERAERVAETIEDEIDREVGLALAEITARKRVSAERRLKAVLEREPRHEEARAALLRLQIGYVVKGGDPEALLAPPLTDAERALADAWVARERDRSGASLLALDPALAAIPTDHPLAIEASRLRIQARLASGDALRTEEAARLAEAGLGDRPRPQDLLLRAEAYAAAGEDFGMLETLGLVLDRVNPRVRSNAALVRRVREMLRESPDDPELRSIRASLLRRLGGG